MNTLSDLRTERVINTARFVFTAFFLLAGYSAYKNESGVWSWGSIFATTAVFLALALTNEYFIRTKRLSPHLIYISTTVEFLLIFLLKYFMHYTKNVGFGYTMKEPATYLVYFLFLIMNALRYDKRLNLYAGFLAVITATGLLLISVFLGGMHFTNELTEFFAVDTLRASSEISKILFLFAFVYFLQRMAGSTNEKIYLLAESEKRSTDQLERMKEMVQALNETASALLAGSADLNASSSKIDGILARHGSLMSDVTKISVEIEGTIGDIREKSNFQYRTVEDNFSRIKEISDLMETIYQDSRTQNENARNALELAEINESNITETIKFITYMRENSKKIEEISRTISEIADKTNLLSLNAAIESARAGEHGKGFAVVADEISKLATMSIDSSKEIADIIRNTVSNIEGVSSMIENLAGYLASIISFVKENSLFMSTLNENTRRELDESRDLYSSSMEVDSAAKTVLEQTDAQASSLVRIREWFDEMNTLGRDVANSIKDIQALAERLAERAEGMRIATD
ncbi:MAG: hypothetical protein JW838_14875 [Spirochaetes bacterium]|nr:hypothetical protein [Spirochaetota bacterium]